MSQENELDNSLVGYAIITFLIVSGVIVVIKFNQWIDFIGLLLIFFGSIFLSVQLHEDKLTKYCFTPLGIAFLVPALFLSSKQNIIFQILFVLLITLAIVFFVIGFLYSFKKKINPQNTNEESKVKTAAFNFREILFKLVDIVGIGISLSEIIQKLFLN